MSAPLRVLQAGAGSMGRTWLGALQDNPDVQLVGLVDLDVEAARASAERCGFPDVPVATSLGELAARTAPDALINVTVPSAHRPLSVEALLSGLPVLCEKPIAGSVAEALSMIAASELSGRLLMISQSRRYWRPLTAFRRQIRRLGTLGQVECEFFKGPHFSGFREQMAYPLLIDMAIHQFDLSRDLIGADPVAVRCDSFNPPWSWFAGDSAARVGFEFDNGCRFGFSGSWVSAGLETSWNGSWRVSGEHGSALWDGDHDPQAQATDGTPISEPTEDVPEQIRGSLAEFVAAVASGPDSDTGTGAAPAGEAHSNVISLAMVEAAIQAAESGQRVLIADVLTEAHRQAIAAETDPRLAEVLRGWSDVRHVVGRHTEQAVG